MALSKLVDWQFIRQTYVISVTIIKISIPILANLCGTKYHKQHVSNFYHWLVITLKVTLWLTENYLHLFFCSLFSDNGLFSPNILATMLISVAVYFPYDAFNLLCVVLALSGWDYFSDIWCSHEQPWLKAVCFVHFRFINHVGDNTF